MAELPLFPLPETVVFPGMTIPLRIFEDRYKQMIKDCLRRERRRFVIALAKTDIKISDTGPATYDVGSFLNILSVTENRDGTYNVLAHGQERCYVRDLDPTSHPYYTVGDHPYPLERSDPNVERLTAWDTLELFRDYARTFFTSEALQQVEAALPEDLVYQASFICANLRIPAASRRVMLEAPSLVARFQVAQKLMRENLALHRPARAQDQGAR